MKLSFLLWMAAGGRALADAKDTEEKKVFIVRMAEDPVASYNGATPGFQATRPGNSGRKKVDPDSAHVRKYADHLMESHRDALSSVGATADEAKIHNYVFSLNGFAAMLSQEEADALSYRKDVLSVAQDTWRNKTTDTTSGFLGLDGPAGPWSKGLDGEDVIMCVIDTGIWPEHASFQDDGTFPALEGTGSLPCEFGNMGHNPNDVSFACNNKLLGARQILSAYRQVIGADSDEFDSARDDDGHGTHTASTAAGNADVNANIAGQDVGQVSGIAPRARVIAYKGLGKQGGFGSDLAAAIDQAVADGCDVINYSVGGDPSLTGPDDISFLFAADAGVFVATSASNAGPAAGTIGGPATVPWLTTVGANTQARSFEATITLGNGNTYTGVSVSTGLEQTVLVDAADAGDEFCQDSTFLDPTQVTGKVVLCRRGEVSRVAKSDAVNKAGGAGMILFNDDDSDSLMSDTHFVPSVHINFSDGADIKAYIHQTTGPHYAAISPTTKTRKSAAPVMAAFSSRGPDPVALDIIKPDITAPGVQILAGNSPFSSSGVQGELFQAISGTSMSSPHVAGVFALLKQAHPDWTPAMAKSAIMTTAYQRVRKQDGATPADPFDMGSGHINPGGRPNKGSFLEPGLVYDVGFPEYLGFLCDAEPEALSPDACPYLESIGVPVVATDLNLPSVGVSRLAGSQVVKRTVTCVTKESGTHVFSPTVAAPPGYQVNVYPQALELENGMSADYYLNIAAVSSEASENDFSFGSIEWVDNSGLYRVYSPIAVRLSLFDFPSEVAVAGVSGNDFISIHFGYNGVYKAEPHGFVSRSVISDSVPQDPDQNFNPNDGFSNLHLFNLVGIAQLRIALPPDAVNDPNIDLDIYVFDPLGSFHAMGFNAGTDELIEILSPVDGTWYVFVHGWQTVNDFADYDLSTWQVPLAPTPEGGNFNVIFAPNHAVLGTTETVEFSWSGLGTGEEYLGAISHTVGADVFGFTFVTVNT